MPRMGTPGKTAGFLVTPKSPDEGRTSGSIEAGMSKRSSSHGSHFMSWMLKSMVRLALVTSVACTSPCVSAHKSHESTVPNASFPWSASSRAPGTLSRIQRILLAEKYASGMRPVRRVTSSPTSGAPHSSSTRGAVRRHCHTMAFATGCPVSRFHTTVVSRWLVMPMESMSSGPRSFDTKSSVSAPSCDERISRGSCSTQPGLGKICGKGFCTTSATRPSQSMSIAREDVVPWSSATT